ncbi:hypothetical protein [Actinomadura sp. NEAU-AAG7]|uniref:hypothetical protein n=1 Tax=Actinomadura sp. NEAU-AAG7 TaxID=2839640 RepID=UPI001BE415F6|nr:hypothetical protein [Actinomadura sp. NEAU-AAG7]MBT2210490.1 hypothetical protein [Actinomadura sp. NEAU-AAG7]
MARNRPVRRLLVGSLTYRWSAGHRHKRYQDEEGRPRCDGCREILSLRQEGAPGRLFIVFHEGPGRIVNDGMFHDGGVLRTSDRAYLNLHRPGVVRALLDAALADGHDFASAGTAEINGWDLIDGALERLPPSDRPARRDV